MDLEALTTGDLWGSDASVV